MKPLLPRPTGSQTDTLDDLLLCIAATIEDFLLEAGAEPGKDYSRLDLYKLAQPFALHTYTLDEADISFTISWPKRDDV
ncbi:MAG: hypothetical protein QX199_17230 [Methylococcaceae bacterium]